ncbi:hypothetical protein [Croceibacterium ferulae]|uniref:hypothetical protein n=1 Tax=Croceibacterium ferulae TaxID=1854641 RepID=UPI000F868F67|nr:hypothetical protein [Croceibacterium ferulae]
MAKGSVYVPIVCEQCAKEYWNLIADGKLDIHDIACPSCSYVSCFTDEQIGTIVSRVEAIQLAAHSYAREELGLSLKRVTCDSKVLQFRSKD